MPCLSLCVCRKIVPSAQGDISNRWVKVALWGGLLLWWKSWWDFVVEFWVVYMNEFFCAFLYFSDMIDFGFFFRDLIEI